MKFLPYNGGQRETRRLAVLAGERWELAGATLEAHSPAALSPHLAWAHLSRAFLHAGLKVRALLAPEGGAAGGDLAAFWILLALGGARHQPILLRRLLDFLAARMLSTRLG